MKNLRFYLFNVLLLFPVIMFAQQTITGTVTEGSGGQPLPGVDVIIKGTTIGISTDFDGKYTLSNVNQGDVLVFSYIGFTTQEITVGSQTTINVVLAEDTEALEEVIVIGYGTAKKEDMTGSADLITSKDFNEGPVVSAQQLIAGKIAGVSVTSGSGAPGDGQNIVIRGLGSLSLTSSPLIVVDGIPLNDGGVGGSRNPLNMINPNDIESMVVLKDASATAIYGSRAANGVIMITTKKGKDSEWKFNASTSATTYTVVDTVPVLSAPEFAALVNRVGSDNQKALLGSSETDWQDAIYSQAFGSDFSFSALGKLKGIPMRTSMSHAEHEGILKTDKFKRYTGSLNLNPSLFDDHLNVELNLRGMYTENRFADRGAIGSAISMDPTQSIYDENSIFDGYFAWTGTNGYQLNLAPTNPMASLNLRSDTAEVRRLVGNAKFDYTMHFLPDLVATINVGLDQSNSHGRTLVSEFIPTSDQSWNGSRSSFINEATNKLFDAYFTYKKSFNDKHNLNAVLGHSYQSFEFDNYSYDSEAEEDGNDYEFIDKSKNVLLSYFGRVNYDYEGKYLITATLRADSSSKLNPDDRWGYFPSVAVAWNMHNEDFLSDTVFNELKLRAGFGEVGNVNGLGDYLFLTRYTGSRSTANYQFGSQFYQTFRPEPVNTDLRWEVGRTINFGIDYSLFDRRVSGSINAYVKETDDLIASTFVDPFTNFGNRIDANIGDMENRGVEFAVNWKAFDNENFKWNLSYNIAFNDNEVTSLPDQQFVGGISGGVGNNVQTHVEGEAPYSFLVYEQVYDNEGKPIEGVFVDRNGDDIINDDDRYIFNDPYADIIMGFNTEVKYKNFDLSVVTRANLGNYSYNNVASSTAYERRATENSILTNLHSDYLNTRFVNITENNLLSDHYVTEASFFKVDNITLGYTVNAKNNSVWRFYGSLQNVATITDYEGLDPEITGGIDNNFYPRPRSFVFGLNIDF